MFGIKRPALMGFVCAACLVLPGPDLAQAADTDIRLKGPGASIVTGELTVHDDPERGRIMTCEVRIRRGFDATGRLLLTRSFGDSGLRPHAEALDFFHARGRRSIDMAESEYYVITSGKLTCKVRMKVFKKSAVGKARGTAVLELEPPSPVTP